MTNKQNATEQVSFKKGETIFFEGDVERHFFIVAGGTVQIITRDRNGIHVPIIEMNAGESFGEFALFSDSPRSATAKALTDVELVMVSEDGFKELISDLPPWAEYMMKSFVDRLQNMTDKIRELEQAKNSHG